MRGKSRSRLYSRRCQQRELPRKRPPLVAVAGARADCCVGEMEPALPVNDVECSLRPSRRRRLLDSTAISPRIAPAGGEGASGQRPEMGTMERATRPPLLRGARFGGLVRSNGGLCPNGGGDYWLRPTRRNCRNLANRSIRLANVDNERSRAVSRGCYLLRNWRYRRYQPTT